MVRENNSIFYDDGNAPIEKKNDNAKERVENFWCNFLKK